MFGFINRARTRLFVTAQGAYCEDFLTRCAENGVQAENVERLDSVTVRFNCAPGEEEAVRAAAAATQTEIVKVRMFGAGRVLKSSKRHITAISVLLILLSALMLSRAYIWQISVSGNMAVPTGEILAALRDCGIETGTFWPSMRSDDIRSRMMERLPELAWVTVNISGSRAECIVRERIEKPEMHLDCEPCSIVSTKAGYVKKVTALEGRAAVKPGQFVLPGQELISGRLDSIPGNVRYVHALGSVTIETYDEKSLVSPSYAMVKTYTGDKRHRWALNIGKYRINFYRNSSISDDDCDRIRKEYILGVKGLFVLPVKLCRESAYPYVLSREERDEATLRDEQRTFLLSEYPDGENISFSFSRAGDSLTACMRAKTIAEDGREEPINIESFSEEGISR